MYLVESRKFRRVLFHIFSMHITRFVGESHVVAMRDSDLPHPRLPRIMKDGAQKAHLTHILTHFISS